MYLWANARDSVEKMWLEDDPVVSGGTIVCHRCVRGKSFWPIYDTYAQTLHTAEVGSARRTQRYFNRIHSNSMRK